MNATAKKPRKAAQKSKPLTAEEKAYLATLSPKHRKFWLAVRPLEGKLTKAIAMKI